MIISIKDFIKTGNFGPVEIGMTGNDIAHHLGKSDSVNDIGENGKIVLYAWYELYINHQNKLTSIQNDHYLPKVKNTYLFKNNVIEIDSWFFSGKENQDISTISMLLGQANIKFKIEEYYGRNVIRSEADVIIDFSEEENDLGIKELTGIRYWP